MTPSSVPLPTDNVYKFVCLFGLALIVSGVLSFVAVYSSALDRTVIYVRQIIELATAGPLSESGTEQLALAQRLLEVTIANKKTAMAAIGLAIGCGLVATVGGFWGWWTKIQPREDRMAALQEQRLELEIRKLLESSQEARR